MISGLLPFFQQPASALTTAWLAYGAAYVSDAIWFGRTWKAIGKFQFDALLYGLVTAGIFGWLWP